MPAPTTPTNSAAAPGATDPIDRIDRSNPNEPNEPRPARSWRESVRVYLEPAVVRMFFLGFSAGLPLVLVFGTLSVWLREADVKRGTIGFISWVTLAYGFKWAWAPLVDRMPLPWLTRRFGRRRAWLLAAQFTIACGLVGMASSDPRQQLTTLVVFALLTAFASATQDIALDAYRIESAAVDRQAALAAMYQAGYRIGMIWAGAGALKLAAAVDPTPQAGPENYEFAPWHFAYLMMAASMAVGVIATWLSPEPAAQQARGPRRAPAMDNERSLDAWIAAHPRLPPRLAQLAAWLNGALVSPFVDFFTRYRWHALLILLLIATYRMSDVVLGVMANPFYTDLGFSKDDIADISKLYGLIMTIVGAFIGGLLTLRFGVLRILFIGALLSAATNLLFAVLATVGPEKTLLIVVISADNLAAGIASSAFIAYLSGLTNIAYSATQYALFSSSMLLLPKLLAGFSGVAVDAFGYSQFFIGTALMGVPVLLFVWLAARAPALRVDGKPAQGSPSQ